MIHPWFRRRLPLLLGALLVAVCADRAAGCPFCSMQGKTLRDELSQAPLVVFGTLANAKLDAKSEYGQGTTDLLIERVIKKNEILGNKKTLSLPRYLPTENKTDKVLVFLDVYKGKFDPYALRQVKGDSDMVKYIEGAITLKEKDVTGKLKYFFDYLDNKDGEISTDAYKEFANVDYKEYQEVAKSLPAAKIVKWLENPDTAQFRLGLYASMLGHCGTEKDAVVLRKMLDDPEKRVVSGLDGILAGYAMLKPKEGWEYVRSILKENSKDFVRRYAALRTVRFFWDSRPDVLDKKTLVDGVCLLLDQPDIADFAVEDLRKWGRWELADRVLSLYGKTSHDVPVIHRAIIRYALSCSDRADAAAFLKDLRKKDPEMVKDTEELLRLETGVQPAKTTAAK